MWQAFEKPLFQLIRGYKNVLRGYKWCEKHARKLDIQAVT
jgi:hypothetical protein